MTTLTFSEKMNAPAGTVWFALWDDVHYRKWTAAFCEGSYAVSDWKEGSRVHFLGPDGRGMYANISQLVPNEKMFFTHIGEMNNFEEQPVDEKAKVWTGSQENYTLTEENGVTTLEVSLNSIDTHLDFLKDAFPKALASVKQLAEDPHITVAAKVNGTPDKIWQLWTTPEHIVQWNTASEDWHTTKSENNLTVGGTFSSRMEAKDGSFGFDFWGTYTEIKDKELLAYTLGDGRTVTVAFSQTDDQVSITEIFQPEKENTLELQRDGWQAIMNNFKKYAESH